MAEIVFKIDGQRVSLEEFTDSLKQQVYAQVARVVKDKIQDVECPEHGQRPTVVMKENVEGFEFEIEACCEELVERTRERLSNG